VSKLLSRADACRYLNERGIAADRRKLDNLAANGRGPKFTVIGRSAIYQESELEEFVQKLQDEKAKRGW
jgi:hypothetical protein